MTTLANAIRTFRSENLSPVEFLDRIDQALAADRRHVGQLLDILKEEHTHYPLPPEVYVEVKRRIEHREKAKEEAPGDETRVLTDVGNSAPSRASTAAGRAATDEAGADAERIKGIGDTLNGRFVLEECLGFGGMGMVYKALDLRKLEASDRKPYIAIKVLNVQFRGHPMSLIALQREAKKAQTLAHPNIVTVYDFDRDGPIVYLTMEYLSGKPLSQLLKTPDFKGMPYAKALPIICGTARALAYAHERGFVHCDLKPANIFLTDAGEVKVIDFGIARVFQKPAEDAEATVFDPGSLGGLTPAYASAEMIEHREPDPRDDIYALGCITYELLTGHHPYDRLPATQARGAGIRPQRPKELGRRQWRTLQAALSFDRERRIPTVARFIQGMSDDRRTVTHVAIALSALAVAILLVAAVAYNWETLDNRSDETPRSAAPPATAPPAPRAPEPAQALAAVAPVLAGVPCSALSASLRDNALQVQGYLPGSFGSARLREMLAALPGVDSVKLDVQQVSNDDCGIVTTFAPYWVANRDRGGETSIALQSGKGNAELREGDSLIVDITTPGYDSYVNIDYYALDGNVVHLVPSPRAKANQAPPNHAATIGSMGNWIISKPFGSELIVLLVTPVPLFDAMRPEHESRVEYLQAVEKRLGQIVDKHGADRLSADFIQLNTRRKP